MLVSTKKRKYFKDDGTGVSKSSQAFLVKWFDPKRATVSYEGPYSNEKDAYDILHSYLKHGICCWIINYDG